MQLDRLHFNEINDITSGALDVVTFRLQLIVAFENEAGMLVNATTGLLGKVSTVVRIIFTMFSFETALCFKADLAEVPKILCSDFKKSFPLQNPALLF